MYFRIRGSPSRIRPVTIKLEPDSVEELLTKKSPEPPRFGSRNRNRFRDRVQATRRQETRLTTTSSAAPTALTFPGGASRPKPLNNRFRKPEESTGPTAPKLTIKKFNRFSRPDVRQV